MPAKAREAATSTRLSPRTSPGVAFTGAGIVAYGHLAGGHFEDLDTHNIGNVGEGTAKIHGTGAVQFLRNHLYERDEVIVYSALEGDEAATNTRGTTRLSGREARVPLGETFAWVTNPDLGLTVSLTTVGSWAEPYVAGNSTRETVVRSAAEYPDVLFDHVVFGLRIGFEESSIVRGKARGA